MVGGGRFVTGTITRLVDSEQVGTIAGEDGHDYAFSASAVRDAAFYQLSLGASVDFTRCQASRKPRAEFVRLFSEPRSPRSSHTRM